MKEKFFRPEEDFNEMIKRVLYPRKVNRIQPILSAWTNIVFEVTTKEGAEYFFRFPRSSFWAKAMLKDCAFCKFIYGKTSFQTPKSRLMFDQDRPFSIHEKIIGTVLSDKLKNLTEKDMKTVADDVSRFICELKDIDQEQLPEECKITLLDFLDELAHTYYTDLSFWQYEYFKSEHTDQYLVHGDLKPDNIIVDENNHIAGVIDFGFMGIGNPYTDISRMIGYGPANFRHIIIESYEKCANTKLDADTIDRFIKVWKGLERGYIEAGYVDLDQIVSLLNSKK